ncbi:Arm DNA-binding domain-containing protein (plasmid) [Nicoliella spurrieriana]|uniref:Arm DNA-binding domain-containing protein n=1 Tax=Nicoliella spurrieriana TaxID=2925830 RepID=A0A976RQY7_9LACO|nr:Arm DNA-binding domain-containing protein [Nicoliella spurrieriana]UQS86169.1 Arm DNA-binding domain-containing protein [Nicoliella spurrieriana]
MESIKQYRTSDGKKKYYFRIYFGIKPQTGNKMNTTRRGFNTKKEAKIAICTAPLSLYKT